MGAGRRGAAQAEFEGTSLACQWQGDVSTYFVPKTGFGQHKVILQANFCGQVSSDDCRLVEAGSWDADRRHAFGRSMS
jgi:hypothetical protein